MVAPVTGPYTIIRNRIPPRWPGTSYDNPGYADRSVNRTWHRQKRPYTLPLNFSYQMSWVETYSLLPVYQATNGGEFNYDIFSPQLTDERSWAKNAALAKFNGKVKDTASWLVTLVEHRQAMGMLVKRLFQMADVTKALLKGRVDVAAQELGIFGSREYRELKKYGRVKANAKAAANNFIELSFGWRPLVSDIYSSIDILQRDIGPQPVRVTSRIRTDKVIESTVSWYVALKGYVQCTIGGYVSVSNPNLYLANSLGLVNPATVAFELIPWSFVLGWFVNVEQFLSQFTEYAGLNVSNPYYTEGSKITNNWVNRHSPPGGTHGGGTKVCVMRTAGRLPSVDLTVKKPWHLSAWRGATAASLVVQNLTDFDYPKPRRLPSGRLQRLL
jgi:hypothetical protein